MKLPKRSWMKLTKRYLKGPYMKLPKRFCMKLTKWSYIKLPKRAYMKLPKATFACLKYFSCNKIEHFVVFRWISKNCKECSILSTDHCLCLLICTLLTLYGAMTLVGTTRSIYPPRISHWVDSIFNGPLSASFCLFSSIQQLTVNQCWI